MPESNDRENAMKQMPPQSENVSQPDNNSNKEKPEIPYQESQESQESPNDLQKEILDEPKKIEKNNPENKISFTPPPVNNLKTNTSIIEKGEKAKESLKNSLFSLLS